MQVFFFFSATKSNGTQDQAWTCQRASPRTFVSNGRELLDPAQLIFSNFKPLECLRANNDFLAVASVFTGSTIFGETFTAPSSVAFIIFCGVWTLRT